MEEETEVNIDGYVVYRNDRDENGGGILLAVKKELKYVTTEVLRTDEHLESLWIVIDNKRIKLRIGVVYFPQEKEQNLKEIYKIKKTKLMKEQRTMNQE